MYMYLIAEVSWSLLCLLSIAKRDLCHESKLIVTQPPSTTLEAGTLQTTRPMICFADCKLEPAVSHIIIPVLLNEPSQHEVSPDNLVAK